MSQTNNSSKKTTAELMSEMRLMQLVTPPSEFGRKPTPEFPRVSGVVMDWPTEAGIVTVVAHCSGDASIYTTAAFGVLGGIEHGLVRSAARDCVKVAEKHFTDGTPTKDYPYPETGRIRFYLVCYDGIRVIDGDLEAVRIGKDKCYDLYAAAQRVVTEFRLTTKRNIKRHDDVVLTNQ
jgi:hypothetical protein